MLKRIALATSLMLMLAAATYCGGTPGSQAEGESASLTSGAVRDKIRGGWVGQTVGVCYGGPTEFKWPGKIIPQSVELPYDAGQLRKYFNNDDIYVELTFLSVLDKQGLDAPAESLALAFAHAGYRLWHANQMARLNILSGIMPPESGYWKNNPHADDIDFQIEADFIGLLTPGMPNTAYEYCDRVGHIMNYGDGFYGGVFVAAMYSHAFFEQDPEAVVEKALLSLPVESGYYRCITDVLAWWRQWPEDWQRCWRALEEKWSEEVGCPECVMDPGSIEAKLNGAYIAIGLLYGGGDFGRTLEISTRCGQDSDCNPSNAGGILGTIIGFEGIPGRWKVGLDSVMDSKLDHCDYSLNQVCDVNYRLAARIVENQGGSVDENTWRIAVQQPVRPDSCEVSFPGLVPVKKVDFEGRKLVDVFRTTFEGRGFTIHNRMEGWRGTATCELWIDGKLISTYEHHGDLFYHRFPFFWHYGLEEGEHEVEIRKLEGDGVPQLFEMVVYR